MPDFFALPNTKAVQESDFVVGQEWFESREGCNACGKLYNQDLDERNRRLRAGEISWKQYYKGHASSCPKHQETLEEFLARKRSERG